jgi:hypothetical protein
MTPLSFEWQWNADYFIFMGFLYLALTCMGCGIVYALIRSWLDLRKEELEESPPDISYPSKPEETPSDISYRSKYPQY